MVRKPSTASHENRPAALITGASAGIGAELARCFAQAGHNLVLVARRADALQALADELRSRHGVQVSVQATDLAQRGAAEQLHTALEQRGIVVDVLVNCAGVLHQGAFASMDSHQQQAMIDLNISALTAMLGCFVPDMVRRGKGRVLNVASVAAFQPIPSLATYAASKAYVLSLSESLAEELKGTGVTVTALCPGITATAMLKNATKENAKLQRIPGFLVGDVGEVARAAFEATERGDAIVVPGAINQGAMIASRATPKWLLRMLGGAIGRRTL
ncbi:SDR family oxidoreductase [Curvibacter sp. APW13]|uniref:SDR family NAD(P)-dependent oxidoreductase n=1 Tax=Curvibacter sp. APW13 TaxID=3077236 RepID=UPI0028DF48EE|nr:SDR family oxidoreductase [Curvibacter sp. APW13]MDT8989926.1 SDR family oxidoreductase [Curvibacter sp. APW13]